MSEKPYLHAEDLRTHENQTVTLKITTSMRAIEGQALVDQGNGQPPKAVPVTITQPEELHGKLEKVGEHFVNLRITAPDGQTAVEKIPVRAICGLRTVSGLSVAPAHGLGGLPTH